MKKTSYSGRPVNTSIMFLHMTRRRWVEGQGLRQGGLRGLASGLAPAAEEECFHKI